MSYTSNVNFKISEYSNTTILATFRIFFANNCEVDIHQGKLPLLFIFVSYVLAMDLFDLTTQLDDEYIL